MPSCYKCLPFLLSEAIRDNRDVEAMHAAMRKVNRGGAAHEDDDDDFVNAPLVPKIISTVDHSHKKNVADLFWLPPTVKFNHRGHLVPSDYLDGKSYQFVTVAGDGMILVWDIRYELIAMDELKPFERASSGKEHAMANPLWAPIFRSQLKRLEGICELSLPLGWRRSSTVLFAHVPNLYDCWGMVSYSSSGSLSGLC